MIKALIAVIAVAAIITVAHSAFAITSAQRVQVLKYQKCLSNFLVTNKTLCHL